MSTRTLFTVLLFALCLAASAAAQSLRTSVYATGLSVPIAIVQDPTDSRIQLVAEQSGRIRVLQNGTALGVDYLDLRSRISAGGERGLLGLALAPDYATSGRAYVNFTDQNGNTVIARVRRSAQPLVADPSTLFPLRFGGLPYIPQPYTNHNGGHLAFGPDGYLYIGLGDGGSGGDPEHRAQNPAELLGKMLRIDVNVPLDDPNGYRVPADNPFLGSGPTGTRPEIWAFGYRNPWRYSFDDVARGGTGALIVGDVGQGAYEEVDYEPRGRGGRNYGWRNREGRHNYATNAPPAYLPMTDPIFEYDHSPGRSITGGYVYRGQLLGPSFAGRYFFADFVLGRIWSLALSIDGNGEAQAFDLSEHTAELGGTEALGAVSSFGVDADGELFILNYLDGRVLRVHSLLPPVPRNLRTIQ
jgi:glucose/arabinose dehydrogenase